MSERTAAVSLIVRMAAGEQELLCVWNKRSNGWSLPGGLVEPEESPEEAQRRELLEETGLETLIAVVAYEGPHNLPHEPGRASIVKLYWVTAKGEPREMEEGCPVEWKTVDEFLAGSAFRTFYEKVLPVVMAFRTPFMADPFKAASVKVHGYCTITPERRIFEGKLGHEDEMHSQDAYVEISSDPPEVAYWRRWVNDLYGKRVRITVEVLDESEECPDCNANLQLAASVGYTGSVHHGCPKHYRSKR